MEQLSVFARFFDGKIFREELLCLLFLPGRTTGEIIFNKLTQFFDRNGLDMSIIVSVVTDGAPSMVGHRQGLLNLRLQGKNHTVADMYEAIEAFRSKLQLLERDIQGRKLHFPRLREHCEKNKTQEDPAMKDFVCRLAENFKERFENSPKLLGEILLFVRQPFSVASDGQWTAEAKKLVPSIYEAALQMEILEMGTSDLLKAQHKDALVSDFWINVVPQARFKNTRDIAMLLLTMFPSTYICESAFSSMNAIKSQDRNRLTDSHLGQCLRIATTEYRPDIRKIASSRRSHFSH
ncbi:hypothetical protein DPEC_G00040580 [Dallia pectoralis]|uniref:Uncharacterized protein n=1 Tax=Dallia pectoralis TaxID=75939 RepID=A0ACC2HEQ5_DALPE|nr:hypothetical protein DPEC_G00040580 [Dallia pectoralis]